MFNLENINEYTKATLAIVMGEHVINMLPKGEGIEYSQKLLDLCWKCIEKWENVEDDVLNDLCDGIAPEDDINFEYYSTISEDEASSNVYLLLGGIASYVGAQVMIEQNEAVPQYWEVVEDDYGYTECILDVVKILRQPIHVFVAMGLRQHRSGRDMGIFGIALDDAAIGNFEGRAEPVSVDGQQSGLRIEPRHGQRHSFERGI